MYRKEISVQCPFCHGNFMVETEGSPHYDDEQTKLPLDENATDGSDDDIPVRQVVLPPPLRRVK